MCIESASLVRGGSCLKKLLPPPANDTFEREFNGDKYLPNRGGWDFFWMHGFLGTLGGTAVANQCGQVLAG